MQAIFNRRGILGPMVGVLVIAIVAIAAVIPVILDVLDTTTTINSTTRTVLRQVPLLMGVVVLAAVASLIVFGRGQ